MLALEIYQCGGERRLASSASSSGKSSPCAVAAAAAMAALEIEREHARKRKERHDSGCTHERKERRPQSEERPPPPPPLHDSNRLENERRAERLSRARRPHQTKRRRPPVRAPRVMQENNGFLEDNKARTPSPIPRLDLGVLHLQLGTDEPERSWGADDDYRAPVIQSRPPVIRPDTPPLMNSRAAVIINPEQRLQKIKKKVRILKKSILKYESDFEEQHACAITQADRMTDIHLMKMYETLQLLQTEKRCIKADPVDYAVKVLAGRKLLEKDKQLEEALKTDKQMADLVVDIEEWLSACREAAGRMGPLNTWTTAQLSSEKFCVQKALLRLEAARGRPPTHSEDRGAARHLYDQYRQMKRALANRSDAVLGTNGELATILEHEPMLFTNVSVDSSSDSQERQSDTTSENTSSKTSKTSPTATPPTKPEWEEAASSNSTASDELTSGELPNIPSNESLHCLNIEELTKIFCETMLQKSLLRRSIKDYEMSFEVQNSRKLQKDDKKTKEEDYMRYKAIKARLRLINALMNKQKSMTMN